MLIGTCITGYMMTTNAYWGYENSKRARGRQLTVGLVVAHIIGVLSELRAA